MWPDPTQDQGLDPGPDIKEHLEKGLANVREFNQLTWLGVLAWLGAWNCYQFSGAHKYTMLM